MKCMLTTMLLGLLFVVCIDSVQGELVLSTNSTANMIIVTSDKPTKVEETAARELKEHLALVTGATFPVVPLHLYRHDQPAIYVGDMPQSRKAAGGLDPDTLGYDGIVIKTAGKDLVLFGHPKRGTLYAVYSFLEDIVGVHWWDADECFTPNKPDLSIPDLNIKYVPKLMSREAHYRIAFDGVFCARLKQNNSSRTRMNGKRPVISPEYGDNDHFIFYKGRGSILHSFYEILPPDVYFEKHPEWYSLIEGKRSYTRAQLCLTNPEMRKQFVQNAKELLRNDPTAKFISITQNDWRGPCECDKCTALDDANGKTHSGSLLDFVNYVAEELEKEFPNVFIETLAYQYTRQAPTKIRPRKNVVIRLCSIECYYLKPLEQDERNADFVRDVKQWSKVADRLFIWNYVTTFPSYMIPHPNMRGLVPDLRFFVKNNAVGLFEQGDAFCLAGDFVRLRNWMLSRLMWNPDLDEKKLYNEFMEGYYGPEVGSIFKEYLKLIHDQAHKANPPLRCYFTDVPEWLDYPTYAKAVELMNRAQSAAQRLENADPVTYGGLVLKVRRERIVIDHVGLLYYGLWRRQAQRLNVPFYGPADPVEAAKNLIVLWKELKVETWREFTTPQMFDQYCRELLEQCRLQKEICDSTSSAMKPNDFTKTLIPGTFIDFQELDMTLRKPGTWTNLTRDKAASNGWSASMPGTHNIWAIHLPISDYLFTLKSASGSKDKPRFHVYAFARADVAPSLNKGNAYSVGIYNPESKRRAGEKTVSIRDTGREQYKVIDLGLIELFPGDYFWMSPPKRPEVNSVYLDRVVIVRE
ncbi:MAG: DUF4838 domain-containing protein [Thermoguttaceae bacterium]|nr:DUF4838 domain-containing protein [Thermoguttaceae bacterium]